MRNRKRKRKRDTSPFILFQAFSQFFMMETRLVSHTPHYVLHFFNDRERD
jgi:hypothetical protein